MTGKNFVCKNQSEYDEYIEKHNIYTFDEDWGVDIGALAKYIKSNQLKTSDVTEDVVNMFRVKQ